MKKENEKRLSEGEGKGETGERWEQETGSPHLHQQSLDCFLCAEHGEYILVLMF